MKAATAPKPTKPWRPLSLRWKSFVPERPDTAEFPALLATPDEAWVYGAGSDPIETEDPITIRIRAMALNGVVGFCLVSADYGRLVSKEPGISPADGDATIELKLLPQDAPARIVVRNQGDDGVKGEVLIGAVVGY